MQIIINFLTASKKITLDVEPSDTIIDVKSKLCDKEYVDVPEALRFFYEAQSLPVTDERTLSDYNIQNNAVILAVGSLRGGGGDLKDQKEEDTKDDSEVKNADEDQPKNPNDDEE